MYKLENNILISCPKEVIFEGNAVLNPSEGVQVALGYKHLIDAPIPSVEWYEEEVCNYTQNDTHIFENWSVKPKNNLKDLYEQVLLTELNRALENDFLWAGHVVKMSESNQKDYLASFSVATYLPEKFIPLEYTFKDNVKYVMQTLDELVYFTNKGLQFVSYHLEIFRAEKDVIKNMTNEQIYAHLKAQI